MVHHASDQHLHESLAKARVTTTPSAALKANVRGFIKACLEPSVALKPRALNLHQVDNLSLKVMQGSKAGTVMLLTLTAHWIPDAVKNQQETTLYADRTALHLQTSQKQDDWATMIQQSTQAKVIEDIFAPTEANYNKLYTLIHVHKKATMMFFKLMPDMDGFKAMSKFKRFKMEHCFPKLESVFDSINLHCLEEVVNKLESESSCSANTTADILDIKTLWERNNVVPSIPVDLISAKSESLVEIFEYYIRCADKQVEEFDNNPQNAGIKPPIAKDLFCS